MADAHRSGVYNVRQEILSHPAAHGGTGPEAGHLPKPSQAGPHNDSGQKQKEKNGQLIPLPMRYKGIMHNARHQVSLSDQ
jgi:hypothetical protein